MDITIIPPSKETGFQVRVEENPDGSQTLLEVNVPEADLFVLQRPSHVLQPQLIDHLRRSGVAVVVDMDDDLSTLHPNNVGFRTYQHNRDNLYSWKYALAACKAATMVTTSTHTLQKVYAVHGRGAVLDNYVPRAALVQDGHVDTGGFGWAGTTLSHPNDLQVTGDAVRRLIEDGHLFRVVGGPSKVKEVLRLKEVPDNTGTIDLINWIKTISTSYDVGMVPLAPTSFNTAKSRLKGIEHMAAGVPWIASPREEYRRLHRESGCGILVEKPKDWYAQLKRLLADDVLRKEQAEAGREYMQSQTYEANAYKWAEAWTEAVNIQRGQS